MDPVPDIIDRLYDTVADSDAWPSALSGICKAVGGHHAVIVLRDLGGGTPFIRAMGVDPVHLARFQERAAEIDPLIHRAPPGVTHHRAALLSDEHAARMDFYNDVIRPMDGFRAMLSVPLRRSGLGALLAVCRPRRRRDFTDCNAALLDQVLPHLARVLTARQSLDAAQLRAAAILEAWDRTDMAMAIVDADLRPLVLNRRAEAVAARSDGLTLSGGRLAASGRNETRLLRQLVRRTAIDPRVAEPVAMRLTRRSPAASWLVSLHRLPVGVAGSRAAPLVALLLDGAGAHRFDIAGRLRVEFGLTAREAAVAAALAQGDDLAAVARRLGIAAGTARNYLKSAFLKTDTHRQAELVSLALRATRRAEDPQPSPATGDGPSSRG